MTHHNGGYFGYLGLGPGSGCGDLAAWHGCDGVGHGNTSGAGLLDCGAGWGSGSGGGCGDWRGSGEGFGDGWGCDGSGSGDGCGDDE